MTLPGGIGLDVSTADLLRVAVPAAAVALWFGALALVLLLTRPREVDAAPASQALGGDESPAIVSFLTAGWTLTDDAAESTLLDLAAGQRDHQNCTRTGPRSSPAASKNSA